MRLFKGFIIGTVGVLIVSIGVLILMGFSKDWLQATIFCFWVFGWMCAILNHFAPLWE